VFFSSLERKPSALHFFFADRRPPGLAKKKTSLPGPCPNVPPHPCLLLKTVTSPPPGTRKTNFFQLFCQARPSQRLSPAPSAPFKNAGAEQNAGDSGPFPTKTSPATSLCGPLPREIRLLHSFSDKGRLSSFRWFPRFHLFGRVPIYSPSFGSSSD